MLDKIQQKQMIKALKNYGGDIKKALDSTFLNEISFRETINSVKEFKLEAQKIIDDSEDNEACVSCSG